MVSRVQEEVTRLEEKNRELSGVIKNLKEENEFIGSAKESEGYNFLQMILTQCSVIEKFIQDERDQSQSVSEKVNSVQPENKYFSLAENKEADFN